MFRYIGNKTKLLPEIMSETESIIGNSGTVVDLMSGTGSVALEYRRRGYHVIAADVMEYSRCHLVSQLLFTAPPKFKGLKSITEDKETPYNSVIEYLNDLAPVTGYFFNEFSPDGMPKNGCNPRKYFTSYNAQKIDAIRNALNEWIAKGQVSDAEAALLKHTLIMGVNNVANISGTYGYYLSEFKGSALKEMVLTPIEFDSTPNVDHVVLQGFAEELAGGISADLCYIDPPYTKRQYAANYHILETIARGDFPEARGKSGLRDWWPKHSALCTKTRGLLSFEKIINSMDCRNFLISYSEDGLFSLEQLKSCFGKYGDVSIREIDYTRFKSNNSSLPQSIKEYIIKIRKM